MKQVNGEVRLLIILTMLFVFMVPVGFLVITTSSDQHNQEDIRDTGGAVDMEDIESEGAPDTDDTESDEEDLAENNEPEGNEAAGDNTQSDAGESEDSEAETGDGSNLD